LSKKYHDRASVVQTAARASGTASAGSSCVKRATPAGLPPPNRLERQLILNCVVLLTYNFTEPYLKDIKQYYYANSYDAE
jgi:hypothetical protein